ncbi:winged helix-turn-helix domain-containing protein [Chloroflexota bacterium]
MDEKKRNILNLLQSGHEMFTAEIAKNLGMSSATTSKYLEVLKAEGKVTSYKRTPYIYWKKVSGDNRNVPRY